MRPPRELDKPARAAWRTAAAILVELGEDVDLNRPALDAYARAEGLVAALREQWFADPVAVVTGGRGAKVGNPILRELARAEKVAAELRDALMLTPTGRRRARRSVGRPPGAASAPDRAAPPRRRGKVVPLSRELREALGD